MENKLILSLFPGIDLLGRAFEEAGYCVVRGPDLLWGGDIRTFEPPAGHFWGVIGGPPCQDFSSLRRSEVTGNGLEMLGEFLRCVRSAEPEWWMLENVSRVPDVGCSGYCVQRLDIDLKWFREASRLRHVHFGSQSGRLLHIDRCDSAGGLPGAVLANDSRSFEELCRLQGLPEDFDLPGFTVAGKKRAVGNGVPLPMGEALVTAIAEAYSGDSPDMQQMLDGSAEPVGRCSCGCGRRVTHRCRYYDESCRKRAQRKRDRADGIVRKYP